MRRLGSFSVNTCLLSLAIFSCVQQRPRVYSATHHPDRWWPIKDMNYVTYAYYDAHKIYHIN